jgi:hypothetical protein
MIRALLLAAALAAAAPPPAAMAGTWDLSWTTRRGISRSGWLVVRQSGARIDAEIHGKGEVKASGRIEGAHFVLRGSRMLVPYTIDGDVAGGRLQGVLKVLKVERRFTGARRGG